MVTSMLRAAARHALSSTRVYRILPPGELRMLAAMQYQGTRATAEAICDRLEAEGRLPSRFHSAAMIAGRAAFDAGRDDLAEQILAEAVRRFPDAADVHLLRSDIRLHCGDYDGALSHAAQARLVDPDWAHAASQVVWLHYLTAGEQVADRIATEAVQRFPTWGRVLWTVTRGCRTVEQFERFAREWNAAVNGPEDLLAGVRPLAQAAARVGLLDTAVELYAEAILLWLHDHTPPTVATSRTLAGKRPARAVADVCEALDEAGIPFFFAAGTALGLIRDGRPAGHDVDIDVGVFADDWDRDAIVQAFRKHPGFAPNVAHPDNPKVAARHRGGAPIDVFRFYEEDDHVWHEGTFMRWRNTPFEVSRRDIGGVSVPLPVDEELYLEENYGEGWTRPDPDFDAFTDAPNVETTWPEYFDYYLVRRAYLRCSGGRVRAGLRDVVQAAVALSRTPSGRQLLEATGEAPTAPEPPVDVRFDMRPSMGAVASGAGPINASAAIHLSREARAAGDRDQAIAHIEGAMRGEGWRHRLLWHERVTLMETSDDYPAVRDLFWASPRECHTGLGATRAVARAACIAGRHDEGRALLRKAILEQVRRRRGIRAAVAAGGRGVGRRLTAARARDGRDPQVVTRSFEERAASALQDLHDVFDDVGARFFLVAGTFLGLVREGTVIEGDKDLDLGVLRGEVDMATLEAAVRDREVFSVRRLDLSTDRLRVNHRSGVKIDIFPHYEEDGRVWHDGAATRWWNTPFDVREVDFLGVTVLAPADAERYLTESYGDWRTPDASFDARLDAPNVEITDQEYFHSLQHFDLLRAVVRGDAARRRRHVEVLEGLGEGRWLDRV